MSLNYDFVVKDWRWDAEELSEIGARVAVALSDYLAFPDMASAVVMACDDKKIANLNQSFRGKLQPTNVLSWPSVELAAKIPGERPVLATDAELGDIAIAFETCIGEACAANLAIVDHIAHLLIHATLHLLGYDHIEDTDAELMEQIEIDVLAKLSISNPYRVNVGTQ